jgi:hypothetical protein
VVANLFSPPVPCVPANARGGSLSVARHRTQVSATGKAGGGGGGGDRRHGHFDFPRNVTGEVDPCVWEVAVAAGLGCWSLGLVPTNNPWS